MVKNPDYWGEPRRARQGRIPHHPRRRGSRSGASVGRRAGLRQRPPATRWRRSRRSALQGRDRLDGRRDRALTNNKKAPFDKLEVRQAIATRSTATRSSPARRPASARRSARISRPPTPAIRRPDRHLSARCREGEGTDGRSGLPEKASRRRSSCRLRPMPVDGGQIIASELRKVGINLEIIPVEWADWLKQVFTDKNYDLSIVSPCRAERHRHLFAARLLLPVQEPRVQQGHEELDTSRPTRPSATSSTARRRRSSLTTPSWASSSSCPRSASGTPRSKACGRTLPTPAIDLTKVKWDD
jgi:peptide/nickel transport system substrate-binding protein